MSTWRDQILAYFTPRTSRLTLVADPDGLLLEEDMLSVIRSRGFELIPFDDPIAFRFAYEAQYRQHWDRGQNTELVVLLRSEDDNLRLLPYDLLQSGRKLPTFRLAQIFPKLSYPVVQALDRSLLDSLYDSYGRYDGAELGDRSTKSFVLRSVFGCDPQLIRTRPDLLKLLCDKHSRSERFPTTLDSYLVEVLSDDPDFAKWPIDRLIPDRAFFFEFLQEHWPAFLRRFLPSPPHESSGTHHSAGQQDGTFQIPFDEVRSYIDTFFIEGYLTPVPFEQPQLLPDWAKVGVSSEPLAGTRQRFLTLFERLEREIPKPDAPYREWYRFAWRWSELLTLRSAIDIDAKEAERLAQLHDSLEQIFADWMLARFGTLANLIERDQRPVMVHQIINYMQACRGASGNGRVALIVVDGLAIDQWIVIRDELVRQAPNLRTEESTVFAWVPTLTSVSRQSIFAGQIPVLFSEFLSTTNKEESHWRRSWEDADLPALSIGYRRGLGHLTVSQVQDLIEHPKMLSLALVVNSVDDIMHGMTLGTAGMHSSVRQWARDGYLRDLILKLLDAGFAVYLTADHGNIEALGQGRPREGSLVETRGERARVYDSDLFRNQVAAEFVNTLLWPGPGLPDEMKVLLAGRRSAFVNSGERIVAHGGIAIEEVLVPFVRISRE